MTDYEGDIVNTARSVNLDDVGLPGYRAATTVSTDGTVHLILARRDRLGDDNTRYDPGCSVAEHEALGALPLEYIRRLTVARRRHRNDGAGK